MGHVDALSRLPLDESTEIDVDRINFLNFDKDSPIQLEDVQKQTSSDSLVSQVYENMLNGWPVNVSKELLPYFLKRKSFSTEDNCLYYINRIVIPQVLREVVLNRMSHRYCKNENDG